MKKTEKPFAFGKYKTLNEFKTEFEKKGFVFPVSEDTSILSEPINIYGKKIPNSLAVQPLEGFDSSPTGEPEELTYRRYGRYGAGGAGLIWFEAVAITDYSKCNPREMTIKKNNINEFKQLLDHTNKSARESRGSEHKPYNVIQLTHAGRFTRDEKWNQTPYAAVYDPFLDGEYRTKNKHITYVSDDFIEKMEDDFACAAEYSALAGFDAVDIKICHHYLLRELLSAVTRDGKYGGCFENRTRCVFNIIEKIRKRVGTDIDISVRMNAYDANRYPFGWGMSKDGDMKPDLTEPKKLVKMLAERNVKLINVSSTIPRHKPYGKGIAAETDDDSTVNPFEGVECLLKATKELKQAAPDSVFVSTGLSWFRQFGDNVAAGGKREGWFDIGGFGRQAFAYPDFAADIIDKGSLEYKKCCVTCDKCYELLGFQSRSGCVVKDSELYLPIYKKGSLKK
jgi:2,4-dienoyl-CoA reductase-like NADH-dependent reductase (Old Yellow Enzyme family)